MRALDRFLRYRWRAGVLLLLVGVIFFFSNPRKVSPYDYPLRIAQAFLDGHLGMTETPPSWLNEMVPVDGVFYSVFGLGGVLTMVPLAALGVVALPSALLIAFIAMASALFSYRLAGRHGMERGERLLLTVFLLFGNWMWCNLAFGNAWQLAMGFGLLGQLGALYFTLIDRRAFAAGACFALAFGWRVELVVMAPLFMLLLDREHGHNRSARARLATVSRFCALPALLGGLTLAYNQARFGGLFEFGYAGIPGLFQDPRFRDGFFAPFAVVPPAGAGPFAGRYRLGGDRRAHGASFGAPRSGRLAIFLSLCH